MGIKLEKISDIAELIIPIDTAIHNRNKYKKMGFENVYEMKKKISLQKLGALLPPQFCQLWSYANNLKFESPPDYDYVRSLLKIIKSASSPQLTNNKS